MSANFKNILIIGATSGLGEGFTRRFHAQGKKVIAAGRRVDRLEKLKAELSGLETQQMDVGDITTLPQQVDDIIKAYPNIDTVMVIAGIQNSFSVRDKSSKTLDAIVTEVNINLTGTLLLAHLFTPHLLSLDRPATFVTTSSGLAYVPFPMFPTYNATKAAVHAFTVGLRGQLAGSNVHVIELAPPYVDTELDAAHREQNIALQGGPEKAIKPMSQEDYFAQAMVELEKPEIKEAAVGFAAMGAKIWRDSYGPVLEQFGAAAA